MEIVLRHSGARFQQPFWLRIVPKGRRSSEGGENSGFVILKTAFRGIRHGEIDYRLAACAMAVQRTRVGVFFPWPIGAFRKHEAMLAREYSISTTPSEDALVGVAGIVERGHQFRDVIRARASP